MGRFALFALIVSSVFGQAPKYSSKPPADLDAALRSRVKEFYEDHVKGSPRKAEALVAEDSKDIFYEDTKPKFLSCSDPYQVDYNDEFTKAKVQVKCERNVAFPTGQLLRAVVPTLSLWKIEDGKWFYYVEPATRFPSPFGGPMQPGPYSAETGPVAGGTGIPNIEALAQAILKLVGVDKGAVSLKVGESVEIKITSSAPGPMTVHLPAKLNGMEAKLDKATMESGGSIVLKLRAGEHAVSGPFVLEVEQTGQELPIQITVEKE